MDFFLGAVILAAITYSYATVRQFQDFQTHMESLIQRLAHERESLGRAQQEEIVGRDQDQLKLNEMQEVIDQLGNSVADQKQALEDLKQKEQSFDGERAKLQYRSKVDLG